MEACDVEAAAPLKVEMPSSGEEAGGRASSGAIGKIEGETALVGLASAGAIGYACSTVPCSSSPTY